MKSSRRKIKDEAKPLSFMVGAPCAVGQKSFRRYTRELYDHPKASLLDLMGPDGEILGSRGSPIRMRDMDPS